MKLEQILEAFYNYYKAPSYTNLKEYPVHKNPTNKEVNEIIKETEDVDSVRFIADPNEKEVFVFPVTILHEDVAKKICNKQPEYLLFGLANKEKNKFVAEFGQLWGTDVKEETYYEDALKIDWNWIDKYFDIAPLMTTLMRRYKNK